MSALCACAALLSCESDLRALHPAFVRSELVSLITWVANVDVVVLPLLGFASGSVFFLSVAFFAGSDFLASARAVLETFGSDFCFGAFVDVVSGSAPSVSSRAVMGGGSLRATVLDALLL